MHHIKLLLNHINAFLNPKQATRHPTIQALFKKICSGVIHIEHLDNNNTSIASGSGFIAHNLLITNNHVYAGHLSATTVRLSWQPNATANNPESITIPSDKFQKYLITGSDEYSNDYAILKIPALNGKNLYNFKLRQNTEINIGDRAIVLGFPFEHQNLVCHTAMVSSLFTRNNTKIIQIDASVNQSNSGGPLVDLQTGDVIGIVTRKATGLSNAFDELVESLDYNIKALSRSQGRLSISGIDPIDAITKSQEQMKLATREIKRSANVGIGYAFSIEYIEAEVNQLG